MGSCHLASTRFTPPLPCVLSPAANWSPGSSSWPRCPSPRRAETNSVFSLECSPSHSLSSCLLTLTGPFLRSFQKLLFSGESSKRGQAGCFILGVQRTLLLAFRARVSDFTDISTSDSLGRIHIPHRLQPHSPAHPQHGLSNDSWH